MGWTVKEIMKCLMCGERFWKAPFPKHCPRCEGIVINEVARGSW